MFSRAKSVKKEELEDQKERDIKEDLMKTNKINGNYETIRNLKMMSFIYRGKRFNPKPEKLNLLN